MGELLVAGADRAAASVEVRTPGTFRVVVNLDGQLDALALQQAWDAIGLQHPILRAHLRSPNDSAWTLDDAVPAVEFVDDEHVAENHSSPLERRLIRDERSLGERPLSRLFVLRQTSGDRLVFATHHGLMDARASGDLISRLAESYCAVSRGELIERHFDQRPRRLEDVIGDAVAPMIRAQAVARFVDRWTDRSVSTHPVPGRASEPGWAAAEISDVVSICSALRRSRGWSASSIVLALLARSWNTVFGTGRARSGPDGWQLAWDLRAELGIDGGIGNFSATEPLTLEDVQRPAIDELVQDVHRDIAALRSLWPGLGGAMLALGAGSLPDAALKAMMARTFAQVLRAGHGRSFSNVGRWPRAAERWGASRATSAFFVPAMLDVEMTTVVCSTIGRVSHIVMRTQSPGIRPVDVDDIGRQMVADAHRLASLGD